MRLDLSTTRPVRHRMIKRLGVLAAATTVVASGALPSVGATGELPVLWTVGGESAGAESAGQGARISVDAAGNVAVVSGPAKGRNLAITSYTVDGEKRWRRSITPVSGTFQGDWVITAPDGDVAAVGHSVNSSGKPIGLSLVRYAANGHRQWRTDIPGTLPSVGRLVVDATGNTYLAFSSVGDGQDIRLHKYGPAGGLLWSATLGTDFMANDIATSLALTPDGSRVVLTGDIIGGSSWITAAYDTTTGTRAWLVVDEDIGLAARDLVVTDDRAYVTGQGAVGIDGYLTVVAYELGNGEQQWRTDTRPETNSSGIAGLRIALAPSGDLVVAGQAGAPLDWWTVGLTSEGQVRWAVRRDRRSSDEVPAAVFVLANGTAVVSGHGGPALEGGFIRGVTAGYASNGSPVWEAYAPLASTWAAALPDGDICATGGYDALITCWQVPSTGS